MPDQSTVSFPSVFLAEIREICARLDVEAIERMVALLMAIRTRRGRLFILGVGGSAANASHAVNDFPEFDMGVKIKRHTYFS